jgi:hypothetical protein
MPKIVLKNGETGQLEEFEPVDAREILAQEGTVYSAPDADEPIGDPPDVDIPQHQGDDAEMQTGLSIDKYGRGNVVKATPGVPVAQSQPARVEENSRGELVEGSKTARAKRASRAE